MARKSRQDGFFRALLRLFPAEFRGDFGDQMTADFRDQRGDVASRRGVVGLVPLWGRTAADLVRRAPQEHFDVLHRDAVHAVRILKRRPASTLTVILSLAIGIGLNAAVFSVVSGVLWRSLPFGESDRLVRILDVDAENPSRTRDNTPGNFLDLQRSTRAFESVAAAGRQTKTIVEPGEPEDLQAGVVSEGFFETLRVRPLLGRTFTHDDYASSIASNQRPHRGMVSLEPPVVIIGYGLWQRRFFGRPDVVGQHVRMAGGSTAEIIGVMGPEMASANPGGWMAAQWWFPQAPDPTLRRAPILDVVGRLAPGVSLSTAQAELAVIAANLASAFPDADAGRTFQAVPLIESVVKDVRRQLLFLFGAVICVLLVTCVNVVHLFLANAAGRRVELATRVALGATRAHLVRQLLTESAILAVLGGAGGLLLAAWAVPLLVAMAPAGVAMALPSIPRLHEIHVDWSTIAFTASVSMGVALACGIAASLPLTIFQPWSALASARSGRTLQGRRFRRALAVCEIAVALVLVVAAMLMVRTMQSLGAIDLGFHPDHVVEASMPLPFAPLRGGIENAHAVEAAVMDEVKHLPGVVAAGIGGHPMGMAMGTTGLSIPGDPHSLGEVGVSPVGPGYFEALGARLVAGRFFGPDDRAGMPSVAVLNEAAARAFWPDGNAVGRALKLDRTELRVVGVVANMRGWEFDEIATPDPGIYLVNAQSTYFGMERMLVKTAGDPQALVPAIKSIVRRVNPQQPFPGVEPLQDRIDLRTAPRRFILRIVGLFSALGLVLAVIGIYGVLAESVAERVPEIGVRMALGATESHVVKLVLGQGAWIVTVGLVLGLAGAFVLHGQMNAMVFGVQTLDPLAYSAACALLTITALAACAIPARRAARLNPVVALRTE